MWNDIITYTNVLSWVCKGLICGFFKTKKYPNLFLFVISLSLVISQVYFMKRNWQKDGELLRKYQDWQTHIFK